ncbi:MAG: hypothetical protein SGILL_000240 [Bacillariaceae sp.]
MKESSHQELVQIQSSEVEKLAESILRQRQTGDRHVIQWDEEEWHYRPSSKFPSDIARERLALYILAMDAINFCFWPSHCGANDTATSTNFEYEHLAKAMASMARQDEEGQNGSEYEEESYFFSPARLARLTTSEMKEVWDLHLTQLAEALSVPQITSLDNFEVRCKLWNEVGTTLLQDPWNGSILEFLQQQPTQVSDSALSSRLLTAPRLVDRIVQSFPGFRDSCPWGDDSNTSSGGVHPTTSSTLYLYKRAQICVADLNAALSLHLQDMSHITTFADYRVPQLLRHMQVFHYATALACAIDKGQEIQRNSSEEKTIRAATVVAVERLVKELQRQQQQLQTDTQSDRRYQEEFTAVAVDWYLWQVGERMHKDGALKPHHKTRTTFY